MPDGDIRITTYVCTNGDAYIVHGVYKGVRTPELLVFFTHQPAGSNESVGLYEQVGAFRSIIKNCMPQDDLFALDMRIRQEAEPL